MNILLNPYGQEPSFTIRGTYGGEKPDDARAALLMPQMNVASVDVVGSTFTIACRTRASAIAVLSWFRLIPFTIDNVCIHAPLSPAPSAPVSVPPTEESIRLDGVVVA